MCLRRHRTRTAALILIAAAFCFVVGVSSWTRYQLRPGELGGICIRDRDVSRVANRQLDPRGILARAALNRAWPNERWGPSLRWQLYYGSVSWLGFFFIPKDDQYRMLQRIPPCAPQLASLA